MDERGINWVCFLNLLATPFISKPLLLWNGGKSSDLGGSGDLDSDSARVGIVSDAEHSRKPSDVTFQQGGYRCLISKFLYSFGSPSRACPGLVSGWRALQCSPTVQRRGEGEGGVVAIPSLQLCLGSERHRSLVMRRILRPHTTIFFDPLPELAFLINRSI